MKQVITILAFISVSTIITAQKPGDFRGFSWGNSINQVQSSEKSKFILKDKDDALEYQDQLAGSDCSVIYTFNDNDKLINGVYVFTKNYSNSQLYVQDYNKFKDLLTKKYGKSKSEKENWGSNLQLIDKERYGQAIAEGKLNLNSDWETANSLIKIELVGVSGKPSLRIHYTTKTLNEMESKEQLELALGKL